jgi:hypothetical protein
MKRRRTPAGAERREIAGGTTLDHVLHRLQAEICDGVRHGFFELGVTCEVIGGDRRRLTIRAGKSYQFLIPKEDCERPAGSTADSPHGSDDSAD